MRIEEGIKLDFKDVLIRPKRSTLTSRSQVELAREFPFKHSGKTWKGWGNGVIDRLLIIVCHDRIPIIASNMDSTGTFEMSVELARHQMLTSIHKHYQIEDWVQFSEHHPGWISSLS